VLPIDIFRLQNKTATVVREYDSQMRLGRRPYDLIVGSDGLVHPTVGDVYEGPNRCSCRLNGFILRTLARKFRAMGATVIYELLPGLELPEDIVLLHEHSDHHSLQGSVPLSLTDLNERLTALFMRHAVPLTQDESIALYGHTEL